jgi:hypothetical protein
MRSVYQSAFDPVNYPVKLKVSLNAPNAKANMLPKQGIYPQYSGSDSV